MATEDRITEQRRHIWDRFSSIFRHFAGPWPFDRYAGEHPVTNAPRLTYLFAFGHAQTRDELAHALSFSAAQAADRFPDVLVESTDSPPSDGLTWPYQMEVTVSGDGIATLEDGYDTMAAFLEATARLFPAPDRGTPWAQYRGAEGDGFHPRSADHNNLWDSHALRQKAIFAALSGLCDGMDGHIIGSHISKTITLPVAQLTLPHDGMTVTIRDNFHDICVSVDSRFPVQDTCGFATLFHTAAPAGYFDGFPADLIHGGYDSNQQKFSLALSSYPKLLVFLGSLIAQNAAHHNPGNAPTQEASSGVFMPDRAGPRDDYYRTQKQLALFDMIPGLCRGIDLHVVGEHVAGTSTLPVIRVTLPRNGTQVIVRDNFHDICVSVESRFPIQDTHHLRALFNTSERGGRFEGFPAALIHGGYDSDPQKFSLTLSGPPELMVLLGSLLIQDGETAYVPRQAPKQQAFLPT